MGQVGWRKRRGDQISSLTRR